LFQINAHSVILPGNFWNELSDIKKEYKK